MGTGQHPTFNCNFISRKEIYESRNSDSVLAFRSRVSVSRARSPGPAGKDTEFDSLLGGSGSRAVCPAGAVGSEAVLEEESCVTLGAPRS